MAQFDINAETGEQGLKELRQTVEDLNTLLMTCDNTIAELSVLDKSMGLNKPAINLVNSTKDALKQVIPALEQSLVPIEEFVKNMVAASELIEASTAGNLDLS